MRILSKIDLTALSRNVFLTFLGMSRAIRMVFRSNLDEPLPEMVSKTSKRRETSLKKSKKRQAIASAGSGALGSLWGLWELLGRSWRAWGGLQGPPYIDKTPDQLHGGRYVIIIGCLFSSWVLV